MATLPLAEQMLTMPLLFRRSSTPAFLNACGAVRLEQVLRARAGLPRCASKRLSAGGAAAPLRVCYLGGSVTEQSSGYRPRVTSFLGNVDEVPAFCGNCGSKVLSFMVADWVVSRRPDLLIIELVINDGDTLLETDDPASLSAALEGIVRHVLDALPGVEVAFLYMFLRDDLPLHLRTGSKAWAENEDATAVTTYHERVPRLHDRVCDHYSLPSIDLIPLMARLPPALRQQAFRDDCHLTDAGAAFAAAAICAALVHLLGPNTIITAAAAATTVPRPLHERPWGRGRAEEVTPQQLSFFYTQSPPADEAAASAARDALIRRHAQLDMDPLDNAQRRAWWLLYPGDVAELRFTGTRLGLLTMIGPDAGVVHCEIDGGKWSCSRVLLDRWAYFWRLAVVPLIDDALPPGPHVARLTLESERPDASSVLKRKPTGPHWEQCKREGKEHKLWLMHWLIEEVDERERALVTPPTPRAGAAAAAGGTPRLGGAGLASGGRRADATRMN